MTTIGSHHPAANIPCVVEAWVEKLGAGENSKIFVLVNRTPIVAEIRLFRNFHKQFVISGCELHHAIDAPKKGEWNAFVNITTPHMPITSDGKTPNLEAFVIPIVEAIKKAIRKTHGQSVATVEKVSQKDVFLENLDEAVRTASDNGRFRPSVRDLFYAIRPYVLDALGVEPTYGNFNKVITDYEAENGEIKGLYREERGAIYHPHTGDETQLGTLEVEAYERPAWLYGSIVIIEKMGLIEAIKTDRLHDRLDFAPMTSRGFTTRALKDLIDKLADHDEPLNVYCVTDADAPGTMIFETLVRETRARAARKIDVINLGLLPWEAEGMSLASERLEKKTESRRPVGQHVIAHAARDDGQGWDDWLQSNRYELNAMGIPRFLSWLEKKLVDHGARKVVPSAKVIVDEVREQLEKELRRKLIARILREADLDGQVAVAMRATTIDEGRVSPEAIEEWLGQEKHERDRWRDYVVELVSEIIGEAE